MNIKREDWFGAHMALNALNKTDKEIRKKQFDFNLKNKNKNNVTIQYDSSKPGNKKYFQKQKNKG